MILNIKKICTVNEACDDNTRRPQGMTSEAQRQAIERISKTVKGANPNILLIEDNQDDAFLFLRTIRQHGLDAIWVKSAGPAIELLRGRHKFQIIFLDLKLGASREWTEIFEFISSAKLDVPVIVLTGAYDHDDKECKEALKLGAAAIMLKPLTKDQVGFIFGAL